MERMLVRYLTGQLFDMEAITAHVHKVNGSLPEGEHIYIGWDLAHAVRADAPSPGF
jgi:kynureninase